MLSVKTPESLSNYYWVYNVQQYKFTGSLTIGLM